MSHQDQIKRRISELEGSSTKELHYFEPEIPLTVKRHLVMSSDVRRAIRDDFPMAYDGHAALLDFFLRFANCDRFAVSEDPDDHPPYTEIARNRPVGWELWDFRVYAGKQSIRVGGGFADKDTFVAITWDYRKSIGDDFDSFVEETRSTWDDLFAPLTPFKGVTFHDYLSNCYLAYPP
jgi:hypothetical protein